ERFPSAEAMRQALEGFLAASGPPVAPSHLAALLEQRCGEDLAARRRALRIERGGPASEAATSTGPMARPRVSTGTAGAMARSRPRPTGNRTGVVWIIAAVLLGSTMG